MRRVFYILIAAALLPVAGVAFAGPAQAVEQTSASCSATSVLSVMGINAPSAPSCTLPVLTCPTNSPGCAFSARMSMSAATGLGASRGQLRIKNADTGSFTDFFCGGPATACYAIQPTTFLPAGTRLVVTCSGTKDNVVVNLKVNCAASFSPLGGD